MASPVYVRTGQCTLGCGACCRTITFLVKAERMTVEYAQEVMKTRVLLAHPAYHEMEDVRNWTELHGFTVGMEGGESRIVIPPDVMQAHFRWTDNGVMVDMPQPCSMLGPDGLCTIYGQPERPDACANYPMTPQHIEMVRDVCTYAFEE